MQVASLLSTLATISQQMKEQTSVELIAIGGCGCDERGEASPATEIDRAVPSAHEHLQEVESLMGGKVPAFFLDYDGTLTPIVDNPSEAKLSEEARSVLRALAARYDTAIVSGRARATAHGLVQLDELYYAGSHGFDIAGPLRPTVDEAGELKAAVQKRGTRKGH